VAVEQRKEYYCQIPPTEILFFMKWSYRIARVSGIDVKIHATFLLLLAWFGWDYYQAGGLAGAIDGIGFTLLLFLCVLLHEFGHAFAARAFGIRTPDITLLPIGGVARLERMPDKPWQELVVAVAGPAVNVLIGGTLFIVLAAKVRLSDFTEIDQFGSSLVVKLMAVNIMLVAFNAIPAFPMDGGRVLRSLLAMKFDYVVATTVAARVGQVLAMGFAITSFFGGNPMLLFIAIFVFMGAQQELAYAKFRSEIPHHCVSDLMRSDFAAFPAEMPAAQALALARTTNQEVFPVIDHAMHAIGLVTRADLEAASGTPQTPLGSLAGQVPRVRSSTPLDRFLHDFPAGTLVVVENPAGQIVGLVQNPGVL